ncbi:MAG: pilus assembly PilX N-terminal domain-containing protein [Dehalococcoidia bacterium]|nr:pilus assembly PilX N-terminal domain-containing protein [Dehalococcoidia bacterium]
MAAPLLRWRRLVAGESGQALAIALITMIVGGIVMVPFLLFATTALRSSSVTTQNVQAYYAADAGVEYAISKVECSGVQCNDLSAYGLNVPVSLPVPQSFNGYTPTVTVTRTTPFSATDDFETGGSAGWLASWVLTTTAYVDNAGPYRGVNSLRVTNTGAAARDANLLGGTNLRAQFWARVTGFTTITDTAILEVWTDNCSSWCPLRTWTSADSDNIFHFNDLDLSPYTPSGAFWFRFRGNMSSPGNQLYVDDLQIAGPTDGYYMAYDVYSLGETFPIRARVLTRGPQVVIQSWKSGN